MTQSTAPHSLGQYEDTNTQANPEAAAHGKEGSENRPAVRTSVQTREEFDYRPVPPLAPVSVFLAFCSLLGLVSLFGVLISIFGTVLGGICLWRIRQSEGEFGGRNLALVGFVMSLVLFISGTGLHGYNVATEVPEGFERTNFYHDISKKGFVFSGGQSGFHPDVEALDGQKIFVKGYMYPTGQTEDLKSFLLVKDNEKCCFGGQPALTDMIMVEMQDGETADFHKGLVSVAGVFHTQQPGGGPAGLSPVYTLDGMHFERSRTAFR